MIPWPRAARQGIPEALRTTLMALLSRAVARESEPMVLKEEALRQVGIPSDRVLVLLRSNRHVHVALTVDFEGRELVFDNLRSGMVSMDDLKDVYETYNAAP